jgi:ABC-type polar amino acid transport system ATPase subunit
MTQSAATMPAGAASDVMIRASRVSKWYGTMQVLKDVSLDVRRGERIVICGPSGSGKSTFIRCLNQLEAHQQGSIVVDGVEITRSMRGIAQVRREIGMVFQGFELFPHLTALENCTLAPMKVRGLPAHEARRLAMGYLERVHIAEHAGRYPARLSGGQRQRVAIARSLCMNPKIMLFDEPTSALDPEMVKEVLDVIVDLAREGMSMVVVTHELGFARQVADRIVFMDHGEIALVAPPDAFFRETGNARVRQFLGALGSRALEAG